MRREAGIQHLPNLRMRLEPFGDAARVGLRLRHAHVQRLQAPDGQVAVKRTGHGADAVLDEAEALLDLVVVGHHHAHHHVAVAADELGHAVHHEVRSVLQRVLEERRREGVVHGEQGAGLLGLLRCGRDARNLERRIGGRLEPQQLGARLGQRFPELLRVVKVHE
eukprot:scaffold7788_cov239-Pinguiococcus_pyrenoidosus.AAC.1